MKPGVGTLPGGASPAAPWLLWGNASLSVDLEHGECFSLLKVPARHFLALSVSVQPGLGAGLPASPGLGSDVPWGARCPSPSWWPCPVGSSPCLEELMGS